MPTILSHAAVPLALRLGVGGKAVPARLLACGAIASMLPDLDVVGMRFGVAYTSDFGHRGFTHSIFFAALVALACACFYRRFWGGVLGGVLFFFSGNGARWLVGKPSHRRKG